MHCVEVSHYILSLASLDRGTHLKVVTGRELLVDSAGLGTSWAKSNFLRPLLLLCQPPPGRPSWNDRLVNVDVSSKKTTDIGVVNREDLSAFAGVEGDDGGNECVSVTNVGTSSETRRDGEGVGQLTDRVGSTDVATESTSKIGEWGSGVKTLLEKEIQHTALLYRI